MKLNFLKRLFARKYLQKTWWSDKSGQSVVELAIILPILLFIILAIINIGLYIQANIEVVFAAHQGARVGVLTNTVSYVHSIACSSRCKSWGFDK